MNEQTVIYVVDNVFTYEERYAAIGDKVTIHCRASNSSAVMWQYRNSAERNVSDVFDGRLVVSDYVNKSSVSNSTYDLTIRNIEVADAGEYWCIEDEGFGIKHVIELFVTGIKH